MHNFVAYSQLSNMQRVLAQPIQKMVCRTGKNCLFNDQKDVLFGDIK